MPPWHPLPDSWREEAFADADSILLESSLASAEQSHSYLFTYPEKWITLRAGGRFEAFFAEIESALTRGLHLAGYFTYEAGAAMLGVPHQALPAGQPLARLGAYRSVRTWDHLATRHGALTPAESAQSLAMAMMPTVSREKYSIGIEQIHQLITQGDTYQVNFTMELQSGFRDSPLSIYRALRAQQPSSFGAVLRLGSGQAILSLSPELFFQTDSTGGIVTRPMKGTAPRGGIDPAAAAAALKADEKNRAEHIMIVDLLRNDLGRICAMGSVRVEDLFRVEPYATVHQMVSTICGQLQEGTRWQQIFTALFPSGSITGAPKLHTMKLIHQLEQRPRGIYTGAIGHIAPDGSSTFSVAIRTLVLDLEAKHATMGVGGGIVADSTAIGEYRECLLKSGFVQRASQELELIETMRIQQAHIPLLRRHLKRMAASAEALGFPFEAAAAHAAATTAAAPATAGISRLRLTLGRDGSFHTTVAALDPWPSALRVRLEADPIDASDPSLWHKTSARHRYDFAFQAARLAGFDEALFQNGHGGLAEGCVTTLLLHDGTRWLTPPLTSGVLPGIARAILLESGLVTEAELQMTDVLRARGLALVNSVRGVLPVRTLHLPAGTMLTLPDMPQLSADLWSRQDEPPITTISEHSTHPRASLSERHG